MQESQGLSLTFALNVQIPRMNKYRVFNVGMILPNILPRIASSYHRSN